MAMEDKDSFSSGFLEHFRHTSNYNNWKSVTPGFSDKIAGPPTEDAIKQNDAYQEKSTQLRRESFKELAKMMKELKPKPPFPLPF
jgi:hypothetical protein